MGARLTVVTGPARSGKTERLLARYRKRLAGSAPGAVLWIAPTWRSAADVRGRLLERDLDACFRPGVVTFEGFADSVLGASAEPIRRVSDLVKRQLVRRLIDAAHDRGELEHFAPIAETDGLVDLVTDWISELKRLEIWPDDFAAACRQRGERAKDRELLAIYDEYQQTLARHQLYDREGRFWSARAMLKAGQRRPHERLQLVVVDGFTDFTRTQHEILEILAGRVEEMLIALPLEAEPCRADLFAKTIKTLDQLRRRHPDLELEATGRRASGDWPALAHIERELFKSPHDLVPLEKSERIEIIAASRQLGEVEQVARRIKELMLNEHVPPGDIAVVFRSLSDVAPLVREVFAELGIPLAIEAQPKLDASPGMRALVSLLRLEAEDWPFRRLLSVLAGNYFQPDWPEWQPRAAIAAERLIRTLQVPSGREQLVAQVERWAQLDAAGLSERVQERAAQAALALPILRRLADALGALPRKGTQKEWATALEKLARETGLVAAMNPPADLAPRAAIDAIAWLRLQAALAAGDELADWLDDEAPRHSLAEMLQVLKDLLRWEPLPREHDEIGRVRVLSAASARSLSIPYLFFAGLAEKAFPPPDREDRLYSEAESRRLIEAGLPLVDRLERSQEEMLLFYEVLTRPGERLYLSYPGLDEKAQPLSPSSYLVEVERACGEGVIPRSPAPDLSPIPRSPEPLGPADLRIKAVSLAMDGDAELLAGLVGREPAPGLAESMLAGLGVTHARQRGTSFGPFEGLLAGDGIRRRLAEQFGSDHLWSPSRLEQYAKCPYQFYLERVLGLEPLEELALDVDYLARGQLLHGALSAIHRRVNRESARPTSPVGGGSDRFAEYLEGALDELLAATGSGSELEAALREIDRRMVIQWGREYHEQHRRYDDLWAGLDEPFLPAHFEVRFGPQSRASEEDEDPLSTDKPFLLDLGTESIQITGRIDRIDLGNVGGQAVFNVLDYKSGTSASLKRSDIEAGTALQLPLYVMAAEALLLAERGAVPWRIAYWMVQKAGFNPRQSLELYEQQGESVGPSEVWQELRETILERVRVLVQGIRSAQFPMHSADEHCTRHCHYRTVCRVNQVRALGKTWPPEMPRTP